MTIQKTDVTDDTLQSRYLLFGLGDEVYGVPIRNVTEIIGMQPVNTLPEATTYIKGVVNLRGKIIPVIDMRLRFKKPEAPYTDRTCIVVVETQCFSAGLIVDEVDEVLVIEERDIAPPPKLNIGIGNRYLSGIGKVNGKVKLLLDCEVLFNEEETKQMEHAKTGGSKT